MYATICYLLHKMYFIRHAENEQTCIICVSVYATKMADNQLCLTWGDW